MNVLPALPISAVLGEVVAALGRAGALVLEAPPGAGKSTLVPLALLDADWLAGQRILMLEPRRLATRAVAMRMAELLGEAAGQRVGYRMRLESRASDATRVLVVTEGILTRMLQEDPALEGVGLVIFDEFHERHLAADLGLALCLDAKRTLRPDLRLLVMSATLDGARVAGLLGEAPRIVAEGRLHPVSVTHARRAPEQLEREVAATVRRALAAHDGDCLVFLPGAAEIRRLERALAEHLPPGTQLVPLFGELGWDAQRRALEPAARGERKVVLATAIAETSLTIAGVTIVVDSGLARRPRFDPASGMSRLDTGPVSLAAAEQRRGRAGRLAPGHCYRVYTAAAERQLPTETTPEILESDLSPLALDLARWGTPADALAWLDAPPAAHLAQARELLARLGALDSDGRATELGARMAALGTHPRLARMLLAADGAALPVAAALAALLDERDLARARPGERDADIEKRLALLDGASLGGLEVDRGALERCRRQRASYLRALAGRALTAGVTPVREADPGLLLALAYPDRIGQRRGEGGRFLLANGRGAAFTGPDALARSEFIVAVTLDAAEREARILLAAALSREALLKQFGASLERVDRIAWDRRSAAVVARRELKLGALTLDELALEEPDPARVRQALLDGLAELGLAALPWTRAAEELRARVAFLRGLAPGERWPDWSDAALAQDFGGWLGDELEGITRREHLARLQLAEILSARLEPAQRAALERLAPTHLVVPSGSRIPIDYSGEAPAVAVRLQEMFGLTKSPTVGGRVPLTIRFLSPAGRPVQVTRDLESFWARGYAEVKRELKGRYPKHYWPEDPRVAEPTARVRPRK